MGTWGPGLYQNDISEDVKSFFRDQLRRGKTGEEITQKLMEDYREEINDSDDSFDFWCALADTQWDMGRLTPQVKQKAMECLERSDSLNRWKDAGPKLLQKRHQVLEKLLIKLNTPQPAKKKVAQYKLYKCQWENGDVFALPFDGELAKSKGFEGEYLLIQKVSERIWHPGHTIPIVHLKITSNRELPTCLEEYDQLEYIQIRSYPYSWGLLEQDECKSGQKSLETDEFGYLPEYRIGVITTSKRSIPSNLVFLANYSNAVHPRKEFIQKNSNDTYTVAWGDLCERSLDFFFGHNKRQLSIYNT